MNLRARSPLGLLGTLILGVVGAFVGAVIGLFVYKLATRGSLRTA